MLWCVNNRVLRSCVVLACLLAGGLMWFAMVRSGETVTSDVYHGESKFADFFM